MEWTPISDHADVTKLAPDTFAHTLNTDLRENFSDPNFGGDGVFIVWVAIYNYFLSNQSYQREITEREPPERFERDYSELGRIYP